MKITSGSYLSHEIDYYKLFFHRSPALHKRDQTVNLLLSSALYWTASIFASRSRAWIRIANADEFSLTRIQTLARALPGIICPLLPSKFNFLKM